MVAFRRRDIHWYVGDTWSPLVRWVEPKRLDARLRCQLSTCGLEHTGMLPLGTCLGMIPQQQARIVHSRQRITGPECLHRQPERDQS